MNENIKGAKRYSERVSKQLRKTLSEAIADIVVKQKKYREQGFSAVKLAEMIGTDVRYISATISSEFATNFSGYINRYRVREAARMLRRKKYEHLTMDQIAALVGFASRQSFYAVFTPLMSVSPVEYRRQERGGKQEE